MPRRDILFLTIVSVAGFVAIVGFSGVGSMRYGRGVLSPLLEGAHTGGLIAASAAAIFLIGSFFLRARDTIAIAAVISGLVAGVHTLAIYRVMVRIGGGEAYDSDVLLGLGLYWAALGLQTTAVIVGMARWRRRGRESSTAS